MNQSKDAMRKMRQSMSKKHNLTIATDEGAEEPTEDEEQHTMLSSSQMEYVILQMIEELRVRHAHIEQLQSQLHTAKSFAKQQIIANKELLSIQDETQHQMMVILKENQLLKNKCNLFNT
jgi:hypothetical protein